MDQGRHFLFTMTAGRTGTAYLAELLRNNVQGADCHHEILGWDRFGVDTPDVSHMTLFNSAGTHPKVREFWRQKLDRIVAASARVYVETSHLLLKAGLAEHLAPLTAAGTVHLVILERDPFDTIISYRNRFDFLNRGMWWMWYLDPDYPRNILRSPELLGVGLNGLCLWYILEMRARARFYARVFDGHPRIRCHRADLEEIRSPQGAADLLARLSLPGTVTGGPSAVRVPPPRNEGKRRIDWGAAEEGRIRDLIARCPVDPDQVAEAAFRQWHAQRSQLGAQPAAGARSGPSA